MLTVIVKFGILSKTIILFLFLIFNDSFSNENIGYEIEGKYEKSLDNIKFINIEKSNSLLEISKVKILNINGSLYGIIIFNNGKKYVIKREKEIEINKKKFKVKIFNEDKIEIVTQENQTFYIKSIK